MMNMPGENMSSLSPPPESTRAYELSGKIMMSAIIVVFAVVIAMVILHLYARWYILRNNRRRRRTTQLVFYTSDDAAAAPHSGLPASLLNSLPIFVFSNTDDEKSLPECAVCLSEFEDGEKGRVLPDCKHAFHVDCIDMWFHSHSTCPLCRTPVVNGETEAETESVEVVVELSQPLSGTSCGLAGPSSSFGGRRKGIDLVGVSVEIPARTSSFRFQSATEEGGVSSPFRSPTSRLLSFKRMMSREKRPVGAYSPCSSSAEVEEGRASQSQSQATTPR